MRRRSISAATCTQLCTSGHPAFLLEKNLSAGFAWWQDPHAVGVAFRAGGRAKAESGKRGSDRPAAQRKSKSSGGKKRGFAGSKR
jgi:hypothetical protein